MNLTTTGHFSTHLGQCLQKTKSVLVQPRCIQARKRLRIMHFTIEPPFLNLEQFIIINQTKKVMKAKVTSLFFALMFLPMLAFAANIKVTGRVIDNSGEPLIGVSILVKGTSTGTLTNLDGEFSIDVAEGDVLKFSYVGYQPQEVTVTSSSSSINITMIEDAKKLDEVVVTALGIKREQKSLSYNVQQVKGDMLTTNKDANFVNSLAGKVAGVNINASSSGTGGISKVVMRGTKSIMQSSNALYVVDGVPMRSASSEGDAGAFGSKGATEPIADLNPDRCRRCRPLRFCSCQRCYRYHDQERSDRKG